MRLLDKANTMSGPLRPDYRSAIEAYLSNPTVEGWDRIHCIVINWQKAPRTVWQALCRLDRSWESIANAGTFSAKPLERWNRWPDAVTLARAIKRTLDK